MTSSATKKCPICGKSKRPDKKTCSVSCSLELKVKENTCKKPLVLTCKRCAKEFSVPAYRKAQIYCSRRCSQQRNFPVSGVSVSPPGEKPSTCSKKRAPCVVCGKRTRVSSSHALSRVLCKAHKEDRKLWMDKIRALKDKAIGEYASSPYSFYVIRDIDLHPMEWTIHLSHQGRKELLKFPLVQYLTEVKYGRFMCDDEEITFLDGNSQNLAVSNLAFSSEEPVSIKFRTRHNSSWIDRPSAN